MTDSLIPARIASVAHEVQETGDVVVFDEKGNRLLLLNDVGAAVWLLIDGQRSVRDIAAVIAETLPADAATVELDVRSFVESLLAAGVVERR
jgi:hypothetical protein